MKLPENIRRFMATLYIKMQRLAQKCCLFSCHLLPSIVIPNKIRVKALYLLCLSKGANYSFVLQRNITTSCFQAEREKTKQLSFVKLENDQHTVAFIFVHNFLKVLYIYKYLEGNVYLLKNTYVTH